MEKRTKKGVICCLVVLLATAFSLVANAEQSILFEVYKYHGSEKVPLPNYPIRLFKLVIEGEEGNDHIAYRLIRAGRTDENGVVRLGGFTDDGWYRLEHRLLGRDPPFEAISSLYIWAGGGSGVGGYIDALSGVGGPIQVRIP
ncbi:MAG: hypothetical protein HYT77_02335 [Deltaproteobacteria bacterium]|nr:hypothetical protein [Deltaproteobacteria bacterium]